MGFVSAILSASLVFVSLHDGPNCFNAALLGVGFTDSIRYVDGAEYRFYLETFCKPRKGHEKKGDLVVFDDGSAAHGAMIFDDGKIFEKVSAYGSASRRSGGRDQPGVFKVKDKTDSPFYAGERGEFDVRVYGCASADGVRTEIEKRETGPVALQILKLQKRLDAKLQSAAIESLWDLNADVVKLVEALEHLDGRDSNDVYLMARASSLWGALQAAIIETDGVMVTDLYDRSRDLHLAILNLRRKIQPMAVTPGDLRILREVF